MPLAARATSNLITLEPHRKAKLQHLRVGQARVGHVRLHHRGAGKAPRRFALRIPSHARAGASRNGFVVLVLGIAKSEIVHGGLAARHHAQSAEQRVGDAGGGFHIARDHRRWRARVQHAAFRNDHLQGFEATRVQRNIVVNQRAKHIQHRSHAHRLGCIEVVRLLVAGAGEINHRRALGRIHPHGHLNLRPVVQRQDELPVFQTGDDTAHRFLGVVLHMAHIGLHHIKAKLGHHLVQLLHTFFVGGYLGAQIGQVLLRVARGVFAALQ